MKYGRLLHLQNHIEEATPMDLLYFKRMQEDSPQLNTLYQKFKCYLNPEDMLWGQFVVSEMQLKRKNELQFANTILRPFDEEVYSNEDPDIEKINQEAISDSRAIDINEYISKYIDVREKILLEKYNGVIYTKHEEEEDEEEDMIDFTDESEGLWDKFNEQWFFYQLTRTLAGDDFRQMDEIYNTPMRKVLPELSYLAQKNKLEEQQERMQQARQNAMMRR